MRNDPFNIAQFLPAMAQSAPERTAIVCAHAPDELGRTALTFAELNADSDRLASGLSAVGVRPGSLTLLMLRPGLDFISLTFALFKLGAVPVLIDPGMGWANVQNCVRQCRPENFIGIPLAHAARVFSATDAFESVRLHVTAGHRWFWGGMTLREVRRLGGDKPFPLAETTERSPAAVLFTSGGTGTPKGVLYEHGMFGAQVAAIRAEFGIEPGERDLPAFPLFGLFAPALGTTCAIPDLNPSRPAQCDPAKIAAEIQRQEITYTFGSPAIWRRVGPYCIERGITFPNLRRILIAGAPVRAEVLEPFTKILPPYPKGDTYIPYGATEALPVAVIRGSEVLNETWALTRAGKGYCVGRPLPGVTVRVIACAPAVEESGQWDRAFVLPPGAIGEIVVKGPVVTREYYNMPEQTAAAKIYEGGPAQAQRGPGSQREQEAAIASPTALEPHAFTAFWHRMGDMGYFDESGRLWFCGRKAHRVILSREKILYSVCVEAVFENFLTALMKDDRRVALVGIGEPGQQKAVIVVETNSRIIAPHYPNTLELERWRDTEPLARDISGIAYYYKFPVDVRHNAKIDRQKLGRWAATLKTLDWTHAR